MSFVGALLSDPSIPFEIRQQALNRAHADPGIPDPKNATKSFWLKNPHPGLATIQSSVLSKECEVVVVGSGISGVSVAETLLSSLSKSASASQDGSPKVLMLEARDICSGATGRNGGHILETADEFGDYVDRFGLEAARKIMRFRLAHLHEILSVVEAYGLTEETQARKVQFLSAYFDDETWSDGLGRLKRFKDGLPVESREWVAYEGDDIPREFLLPNAKGVIAGPAGALWPYKLVTALLSKLQKEYPNQFLIETNTPVTKITTNPPGSKYKYTLLTPRGDIQTNHIIHSTNAHAAHLLPGLRGRIYPIRGQMSAQTPGKKFPDLSRKHSWLFVYERGFDYLTQLPRGKDSDSELMLGGGFAQGKCSGIADLGIATDDNLSLYCDIHLSGALSAVFGRENWGSVPGEQVKMMWTGNMGFSADGLPWVGQVSSLVTQREGHDHTHQKDGDKKGGEWISAAFSGEGMVHAWLCGKALGKMVLRHMGLLHEGDPEADLSWFPGEMLVTDQRVREVGLPRVVDGGEQGMKEQGRILAKI